MKKARKLGLQSLALVLMAFVLVAGVAFGMTGAWFTNKATNPAQSIALGNGVGATLTGSFEDPEDDAAHALGAGYQYMPGDTVEFSGSITPVANSMEFYVRMKVVVEGTDANKVILGQVTATHESDTAENVSQDGEWNYLTHPVAAGEEYAYTATLDIVGNTNVNVDINRQITITVYIEIVQSANVTNSAAFWADSMATTGEQPITAEVNGTLTANVITPAQA